MKRIGRHSRGCLAWLLLAAALPIAPVAAQRCARPPLSCPPIAPCCRSPSRNARTASCSTCATPRRRRASRFARRAGAPNVLIVLLDDMGFSQPSTFGGPIHMPTLDRLASQGSATTSFTPRPSVRPPAPRCSPAATTTSATWARSWRWPPPFLDKPANAQCVAPLAEMLRLNGFATAAFGKNHETAAWEVSPSGPTDRWPALRFRQVLRLHRRRG